MCLSCRALWPRRDSVSVWVTRAVWFSPPIAEAQVGFCGDAEGIQVGMMGVYQSHCDVPSA